MEQGLITGDGVVVTDEHLPELILHGDEGLAKALRRRALAPLDKETARSRERLRSAQS